MSMVGFETVYEAPTFSGGHFYPPADNTYDLGSTAYSWRNAHFETAVYVTSVVGNWSPSATGTYTLGTSSLGWLGIFLDAASGADADIDIIKLLVTGTPKLWWDESGDSFALTHGLILADAKDIEVGAAGSIKSGATNTDTMLLKANDTTFITFLTAATDVCTLDGVTLKGTLLADGTVTMPALTLGGAISGGDQAFTGVGDMTFTDGSVLQTGDGDSDNVLLKADDTGVGQIEVARLQGAADPYFSMGGSQENKFYNSGAVTLGGVTTMGANLVVGTIDIDDDSGAVTLVDMGVTDAPADGTEESIAFAIDGNSFIKLYSEADSAGAVDTMSVQLQRDVIVSAGKTLTGHNVVLENHTADDTLGLAESGSVHTNYGEDGAMTLTLPASATAGTHFKFLVGFAGGLRVAVAAASEVFIVNGATSTDDGGGDMYLEADDEGEIANFMCIADGVWLVDVIGTWSITQP